MKGIKMDSTSLIAILVLAAALALLFFMMRKKLTRGSSCCGEREAPEKKVKVADKNIKNYSFHYEAKIEGMVCGNCATRVENALNRNDGIYAKVDLGEKKATIHSKKELSKENVFEFLKELPYTLMKFE